MRVVLRSSSCEGPWWVGFMVQYPPVRHGRYLAQYQGGQLVLLLVLDPGAVQVAQLHNVSKHLVYCLNVTEVCLVGSRFEKGY